MLDKFDDFTIFMLRKRKKGSAYRIWLKDLCKFGVDSKLTSLITVN